MLKENVDNVYQIGFSLNIIWPKSLTPDQSYGWPDQNTKLTTWLLSKTDEVRLRLINLRERETVSRLIIYHYVQHCLTVTYAVQKKWITVLIRSLKLKQAICCLIIFVVHDQSSNRHETPICHLQVLNNFLYECFIVSTQSGNNQKLSPQDLDLLFLFFGIVTSLFLCNSLFQYWGGSKKASTSHYILLFFTYLTGQ